MADATRFLIGHPYAVLFAVVLIEQLGLPLPAVPFLLAAGALAATGHASLLAVVVVAVGAALVADLAWYTAGRRKGAGVLGLLCRISLEPDACVRRAEDLFARRGDRLLLWVKFVPGLSLIATPLAGVLRMPRGRFVLLDGAGAALWSGSYIALGFVFGKELESVAAAALDMGKAVTFVVLGAFGLYLLWKVFQRQRFLRGLRVARITPEALFAKIEAGEPVAIVDLRHRLDLAADPWTLPGALWMDSKDLALRHAEIPRDREVVLFCT